MCRYQTFQHKAFCQSELSFGIQRPGNLRDLYDVVAENEIQRFPGGFWKQNLVVRAGNADTVGRVIESENQIWSFFDDTSRPKAINFDHVEKLVSRFWTLVTNQLVCEAV